MNTKSVKRERPPQPSARVKIHVAMAQLLKLDVNAFQHSRREGETLKAMLGRLLVLLAEKLECTVAELRLDHNPALILRAYNPRIKDVAARYSPHAHSPDDLIYRSTHGHHIKTNVRGDGARRSDTAERMHQRRMDENRGLRKRKPKAVIRSANRWPPKGSQKIPRRRM